MRREFEDNILDAYNIAPHEIRAGDQFGYKVVAVIYHGGFWAAYRGDSSLSGDEIANHGDKISLAAAAQLFPTLHENYRWSA